MAAGGYRRSLLNPGQPRTQCWHNPQRCICCPKQNHSRKPQHPHPHGEGVAENAGRWQAGRNQIYTAASYRSNPKDTQNPIGPFAPAAQLRFASVIQRSRVGRLTFSSPISTPSSPAGVASFASRSASSHLAVPPANQPASPPLCPPPGTKFAFPLCEAHTPLAALQPGCFACLAAPRPCHRGGRSSALHPSHQCVIEAIPTLAAINTPVRLGNPLPLAKHVSSLQGLPRGGGECHPLASPDRLATHDMTLSTRAHDASSGLHAIKATNLCTQLLPRLRGAHGQQLLYSISLAAGPVPWSHCHATSCLLLLTIIVIRPIPQLLPSPVRRQMLRRASSMCTNQAVVRITHMSGRALVETSLVKPRGLFRRCYCSGAAVFGHDQRP